MEFEGLNLAEFRGFGGYHGCNDNEPKGED